MPQVANIDDTVSLNYGDVVAELTEHQNTGKWIGLTVTSPPYNLGKEYEGGMDYERYMDWTTEWTSAVARASVDGGRLCVNIPLDTSYGGVRRPFYHDFLDAVNASWNYHTTIVWNEGTVSSRTAWGSFARPTAPFVTAPVEMIAVFYLGDTWKRSPEGKTWDIQKDEFIAWTLGIWDIPNVSAKRVGHPAPFCEAIPERLIKLYSFKEDLICDPFVGSGTTCRVARRLGRKSFGIDNHAPYLEAAEASIRNDGVVVDAAGNRFVQPLLVG